MNKAMQLTSFVGRQSEQDELMALLRQPQTRLITLAGTGGVGKTRLALQVAGECSNLFRNETVFIPLQPVVEPPFVVFAISTALGISAIDKRDAYDQLLDYLEKRQMLLILDNFEHLLEAASILPDILARSPDVKMIVTSREVLNLREEQVYHLQGLAVEDDAVQLFIDRARLVRLDFAPDENDIRDLCHLVSGIPLAIELAAAWVKALTPREIKLEIQRNLEFLTSPLKNVPERHRSIRAVFGHSWNLLSDAERDVLKRLSVFHGSFTRQAAHHVAGAELETLSALVDKSMLRYETNGRYTIHELLRQYVSEQLSEDEFAMLARQHADYYQQVLREAETRLKSDEQVQAVAELEEELDNIRRAWTWMVANREQAMIWNCLETLGLYYQMRSRLTEGYEIFTSAVRQFEDEASPLLCVLLMLQSWFAEFSGALHPDESSRIVQEAAKGILANQLYGLLPLHMGRLAFYIGSQSRDFFRQSLELYQSENNTWGTAWTLHNMAHLKRVEQDFENSPEVRTLFQQAIDHFEAIGDEWSATWARGILGRLLEEEGQYDLAFEHYMKRLDICQEIGDTTGVAWTLQQIAQVAIEMENRDVAKHYGYQSLKVAMDVGSKKSVEESLLRIARLYEGMGQYERAVQILAPFVPNEQQSHRMLQAVTERLALIKAQMPPEQYASAYHYGRTKSIDEVAIELLDELAMQTSATGVIAQPLIEPLSSRELEVLNLVAEGLSNREIAKQLFVSTGTVKKHLNNIFGKLHVSNRVQAVARARQLDLFM